MPNTVALALAIANFFVGFVCFLWACKLAGEACEKVETGIMGGVPFSLKGRWTVLYTYWVGFVLAAISAGLLTSLVGLAIGAHSSDEYVRAIAHVNAVVGAVGGFGCLANAIPQYLHYASVLRQAEQEAGVRRVSR
ncbi:MAG: hypothetical protein AAF500_14710 [Myxococcota bacterium]